MRHLYPWLTAPALTAELDHLARRTGVTLTGSGFQDTFWINMVSMLMGTAHRIDSVVGRALTGSPRPTRFSSANGLHSPSIGAAGDERLGINQGR